MITGRLALIIILLCLYIGCVPTKHIDRSSLSAETILTSLKDQQYQISTFYGEGKVTIETPSYAHSASFVLYVQKPDTIYIRIHGPFGIRIGSALITRNDFVFYNALNNKLLTGMTTPENLEKILNIAFTFDDLMSLVCGGSLVARDEQRLPDELSTTPEYLTLRYYHSQGNHLYYIDPVTTTISKIQIFNTEGIELFEQRFLNYQRIESKRFPKNIHFYNVQLQQRIALSYTSIALTKPENEMILNIPQNAEIIRLQ